MKLTLIDDRVELVDWFANKMRVAEPQGIVSSGVLRLFERFIEELKAEDMTSITLSFEEMIPMLAENVTPSRGNVRLVEFFAGSDCLQFRDAENGSYGAASVFFEMAARHLNLSNRYLKFTWSDVLTIRSTPRFEKRENVRIRVRVGHFNSPSEWQWPDL
jgi:hypothetical protein